MKKPKDSGMWRALMVCGALALGSGVAYGQAPGASSNLEPAGTPLIRLIETVSKKTGKSFIIDPRVNGNASLVGIDPSKVTYNELLAILQVHGIAAAEIGGIVRVVPDANARTLPGPVISGNEKHADAELVTRVIEVKSVPAAQLVPILRSLLPQNAHLAAMSCRNALLMVDSYANVKRIESIVASMDKGDPLALPKCALPETQSEK